VTALVLADPLLGFAADVLDDLENVRIANENRLRQLTRAETDSDGEDRGFGLSEDHPDVAVCAALVAALQKAEHDAELELCRKLRRHPLGPWMRAQRGIGEKQGARLLATIGDPYWNTLHDRPRTVSELWAYCGYHVLPAGHTPSDAQARSASGAQLRTGHGSNDAQASIAGPDPAGGNPDHPILDAHGLRVGVAASRKRGTRANWSATAKSRAHLIAKACLKQLVKPCAVPDGQKAAVHVEDCACSPYRRVYDGGRVKYADAVHEVECRQCGPKGHPAQPGSALSEGHKHARALRLVSKEILKDLWREAKRLHEHTG
jgi:hypothetical protein